VNARRLLIVDDDVDIADFVADAAKELGFLTTTLNDPNKFSAVFKKVAPSGLILDLAMPNKDGIEVIQLLGEMKCDIPILLFSGFDPGVVEAAARLGRGLGLKIMGILRKPATLTSLRTALTDAFPSGT
jgi:DNA-binding response OmpR family regulator